MRPEDAPLIHAAIQLGEWLYVQPGTDQLQQTAIAAMLTFLRNLPNPPPAGLHGEFGFEYQSNDESGHSGCWTVCVCRALFEICSCGLDHITGFSWELCSGHKNMNDLTYAEKWISQVANPYKHLPPEHTFVIEASTWSVED